MAEIRQVSETRIEVDVTRIIAVGERLHISPSYGYSGITEDVVEVYAIGSVDDIHGLEDDARDEIVNCMESHIEAELSIMDGEDYTEHKKYLEESIWVVYCYPYNTEEAGQYYSFPVDEFLAHTSQL
jgi:hypothetical protein